MKSKIFQLISNNRTEEAVILLATTGSNEAILQQSRYNNGKRNYNMGTIDFGEQTRIQNQINKSLLELANDLDDNTKITNVVINVTIESKENEYILNIS